MLPQSYHIFFLEIAAKKYIFILKGTSAKYLVEKMEAKYITNTAPDKYGVIIKDRTLPFFIITSFLIISYTMAEENMLINGTNIQISTIIVNVGNQTILSLVV